MRGKDAQSRYELTKAARYTNHSQDPSAQMVKVGNEVYLVALKAIPADTEVLVDYRKTASVLGPGSYITFKGKKRTTWEQLEKQSDDGPMFTWVPGMFKQAIDLEGMDPTLRNALLVGGAGATIGGLGGGLLSLGGEGRTRAKISNDVAEDLLSKDVPYEIVSKLQQGEPLNSTDELALDRAGIDLDEVAPKSSYWGNLASNTIGGAVGLGGLGALVGGGATELGMQVGTPAYLKNQLQTGGGKLPRNFPVISDIGGALGDAAAKWYRTPAGQQVIPGRLGKWMGLVGPTRAEKFKLTDEISDGAVSAPLETWNKLKGMFKSNAAEKQAAVTEEPHPDLAHLHKSPGWAAAGVGGITGLLGAGAGALGSGALTGSLPAAGIGAGVAGIPIGIMGGMAGYGNQKQLNKDVSRDWVNPELINFDGDMSAPEVFSYPEGELPDDWREQDMAKLNSLGFHGIMPDGGGNYYMKDANGNPVMWFHELNRLYPASDAEYDETYESYADEVQYPLEKQAVEPVTLAAVGLGLGAYSAGMATWEALIRSKKAKKDDKREKKRTNEGDMAEKQALDPMITSGLGMAIPGALAGGIIGGARGAISPGRQPVSKRQAAILRKSGVPEATVVKMEAGEDLSDDEETMLNDAGLDIDKTLPQKGRFGQALRSAGKGALIGGGIGGVIGAGIPEYERWRFKNTVREAPHTVRFPQSLGGRDLARVTVDELRSTWPKAKNWPDYSSMTPLQRKQIGQYVGDLWSASPRADQYAMMKGMPGINFGFESISKLPGRMWDTAFGLNKSNAENKTIVGETAKGLQGFANLISDKVEDADKDKKQKDKEEKQLERAVARNARERKARRIAKDRDWMNKYDGDTKISGHSDPVAAGLGNLSNPVDFGAWMAHRLNDFNKGAAPQAGAQSHPLNMGQNKDQMLADMQNAKADPRLAAASRGLPGLPQSLQQQQQPGVGQLGNGPLTTGGPLTRHGMKERGGLDNTGMKLGAAPPGPSATFTPVPMPQSKPTQEPFKPVPMPQSKPTQNPFKPVPMPQVTQAPTTAPPTSAPGVRNNPPVYRDMMARKGRDYDETPGDRNAYIDSMARKGRDYDETPGDRNTYRPTGAPGTRNPADTPSVRFGWYGDQTPTPQPQELPNSPDYNRQTDITPQPQELPNNRPDRGYLSRQTENNPGGFTTPGTTGSSNITLTRQQALDAGIFKGNRSNWNPLNWFSPDIESKLPKNINVVEGSPDWDKAREAFPESWQSSNYGFEGDESTATDEPGGGLDIYPGADTTGFGGSSGYRLQKVYNERAREMEKGGQYPGVPPSTRSTRGSREFYSGRARQIEALNAKKNVPTTPQPTPAVKPTKPQPTSAVKPPATMWGKFTPDQFHKETDVYLKLRDQYKDQPKMLKTMYDSQGYKDWATAGKAYMNHKKPPVPAKPQATAPKPPTRPTRPSPGSAFPPRTPPTPMQKANSADLMDQLRSVVAEKEAGGDLPPKKPKYKGAPRSRTIVKPRRKHKDKDDDVGSSTIQYINRRGRPVAK
jgi:hypothetical protein